MADEPLAEQKGEDLSAQCVPDDADTLGKQAIGNPDAPQPGMFMHLLSSLKPGQDLTRVLIPVQYLEPRSLLEKMGDMFMHPQLFTAINDSEDPVERFVSVCKWFLSGWHYETKGVKKPYNPIVGETCAFFNRHEDGSKTSFFGEQVLHRPPVSALYAENRQHNIAITGQVWTQSKFHGNSAGSNMIGGLQVNLTNRDGEMYYITYPSAIAKGLFVGTLRMEMSGESTITCAKTGISATFTWKEKPMWGGDYCCVSGVISQGGKKLFKVEGKWNEVLEFRSQKRGIESSDIDMTALELYPKYVLPVEQQGVWESRRLWQPVTNAFVGDVPDWDVVNAEKAMLEEAQRRLPCHSVKGQGTTGWPTKKFHLQAMAHPLTGEQEELWVFDDANLEPYQEGEAPRDFITMSAQLPDERPSMDEYRAAEEAAAQE